MLNMIWYACYGSNMDETRFLKYIQGGDLTVNGKTIPYTACPTDTNSPRESEPYLINRRFYFAKKSQKTWNGHGVGFISTKCNSRSLTYAKLYLISRDQFNHLYESENNGNTYLIDYDALQRDGILDFQRGFYNRIIQLKDNYKGYPILTFTNSQVPPKNRPNAPMAEYVELISNGLRITHNLTDEDIARYIKKAKRR